MARLIDRLLPRQEEERSFPPGRLADALAYGGNRYLLGGTTTQTSYGPAESSFPVSAKHAVLSNGMVYGLVRRRVEMFAQARLVFKRLGSGPKPMAADVLTTAALAPVDNPVQMLARMELDVAVAGNSYWVLDAGRLWRLPPEDVSIVVGSRTETNDPPSAWDAEIIGYVYQPRSSTDPMVEVFMPGEVCHYRPEEDPDARFRGMSWLRPALEDIASDNGARRYVTKFFDNAATPNLAFVFPPEVQQAYVEAFRDAFLAKHEGVDRSFRTAFIGGGADPKVIGSALKDVDTEHVRQQIHADLCMAAGIPPMAAGIQTGTYANTKESNRAFADVKGRFLWLALVEALRPVIPAPAGTELWYDVSGVSALQSDALDDAEVLARQAQTMRTLVDGGFDPMSVVGAVSTGDLATVSHSGLVSVQLLPPGQGDQSTSSSSGDGADNSDVLDVAIAAQRLYLAVTNGLITTDEAREQLNKLGAGLPIPMPNQGGQ